MTIDTNRNSEAINSMKAVICEIESPQAANSTEAVICETPSLEKGMD